MLTHTSFRFSRGSSVFSHPTRSEATPSPPLISEWSSLSAHFTQVLTVRGAAMRQPVDVWHLTLCVMVYSVFHSVLVTAVGGRLPHLIGSLSGQRCFCGVVEEEENGKRENRWDSPTAIHVREGLQWIGYSSSTSTHHPSTKVMNVNLWHLH